MNAIIMRERALIKVRLRHLNRLKQASSSYHQDFPSAKRTLQEIILEIKTRKFNKLLTTIILNASTVSFHRKKVLKKTPKENLKIKIQKSQRKYKRTHKSQKTFIIFFYELYFK